MLFPSGVFLYLFLPTLLAVYFLSPKKIKNLVLLIASLVFYAWGEMFYVGLLIASIVFNYVIGLIIGRQEHKKAQIALSFGVIGNLLLLSSYKYSNFIVDNINGLLQIAGTTEIALAPVHLPIGISFYTFQALSYLIDVYRKTTPAQKNPLHLALYISLFPQLIAGPIVRYHDIADQITNRRVTVDSFYYGMERFVLGLSKKIIIANPLAFVADSIFAMPADQISLQMAWLGIIAYTFQIYFDFSAYSDMAIGLGRMFGFKFLENFNYPYISKSIQEFWRRWHISLSNWFRDYLYIPLGGNRLSEIRTYINLIIVFLLCGFWHGAAWNFVVWGLLHGLFLILERLGLSRLLKKCWPPLSHLYCITAFTTAWVFFRSETLTDAWQYLGAMIGLNGFNSSVGDAIYFLNPEVIVVLILATILSTPIYQKVSIWLNNTESNNSTGSIKTAINSSIILLLLFVCVIYIAVNTYNPFIYFRF